MSVPDPSAPSRSRLWLTRLAKLATSPRHMLHRALEEAREPHEVSWEAMRRPNEETLDLRFNGKPLPRVAVVKQDVYHDLYCCPHDSLPAQQVASSLMRTGPVALLTRLHADFWIVATESDAECAIWKEKWTDCRQHPVEYYEALRTAPFEGGRRGHTQAQGEFSVNAGTVNWGDYDFVISFDIAVPARITCRYPNTIWCYCISEPGMGAYRRSHRAPIAGYDLFLNQRFRCLSPRAYRTRHEIEFPYYLQYYGCFDDLFGPLDTNGEREGVMLESHTAAALADELRTSLTGAFGTLRTTGRTTLDTVNALRRSKYFLAFYTGRKLWGNAMIEAVAAGCLALGCPEQYWHCCLFTPETTVRTQSDILASLDRFERDPQALASALADQRARLDYLCYQRPLRDLLRAGAQVRR